MPPVAVANSCGYSTKVWVKKEKIQTLVKADNNGKNTLEEKVENHVSNDFQTRYDGVWETRRSRKHQAKPQSNANHKNEVHKKSVAPSEPHKFCVLDNLDGDSDILEEKLQAWNNFIHQRIGEPSIYGEGVGVVT